MFRKLCKYGLLVLMVVTGVGVMLLVSPPILSSVVHPVRMFLIDTALQSFSRSLNGRLELGDLEGSLLSAPVIRDFRILDAAGEPVLVLPELRLRYDLGTLFRGRLQVEEIRVLRPSVNLVEDERGQLNLQQVFAPMISDEPAAEKAPLAIEVVLAGVYLEGGHVGLQIPAVAGVQSVDELELALTGALRAAGLQLDLERFSASAKPAGVDLKRLVGSLQLTDGRLELRDWELATVTTNVTLGGVFPSSADDDGPRLELRPLNLAEIGRILDEDTLRGDLTGSIAFAGDPDTLRADVALQAGDGRLSINADLARVADRNRLVGEIALSKLDPSDLISLPQLIGDLNAKLAVFAEGSNLEDLSGNAELEIGRSALGEIRLEPSRMAVTAQSRSLRIHELNLNTSVVRASGTGAIGFAGRSDLIVEMAAELEQLQPLLNMGSLGGDLNLAARITGTWPDLAADGTLQARDLVAAGAEMDSLDLSFQAERLGDEPKLTAEVTLGRARASGLELEGGDIAAQYRHARTAQRATFAVRLQQSENLRANLDGTIDLAQTAALELAKLQLQIADRNWVNDRPLRLTLAPDRYELAPFGLQHAEERISLSGGLVGDRLQDIRIQVEALDLDFVREFLSLPDTVGGRADVAIEADGTLAVPRFAADVDLNRAHTTLDLPWERAVLRSKYAQEHLTLDAELHQHQRRAASLNADLPANLALIDMPLAERLEDQPLTLDVEFDRLDLSRLTRGLPTTVAGILGGAMSVAGSYADVDIEGSLALSNGSLPGVGKDIEALVDLGGRVQSAASVSGLQAAIHEGNMSVQVPEFKLEVPKLSVLNPALSELGPAVVDDLKLQTSGAWGSVGLSLQVADGSLRVSVPGYPPAEASLAADLTPGELVFGRFRIKTPESELSGKGRYGLSDGSLKFEFDVASLQFKEWLADFPPEVPSLLDGRIAVSGSVETPVVAAQLGYAGAQISASGSVGLAAEPPRYQSKLEARGLDLGAFPLPTTGIVDATVQLEGSGFSETDRNAALAFVLDSRDLTLAPGLRASLNANLTGTTVEIEALEVDSTPVVMRAQGTLSQHDAGELRYSLTARDLSPLARLLGAPTELRGEVKGTLSGELATLRSSNTIDFQNWRYGEWRGGVTQGQANLSDLGSSPSADLRLAVTGIEGPGLASSAAELKADFARNSGILSLLIAEGPLADTEVRGHFEVAAGVDATFDVLKLQYQDWVWRNAGPVAVGTDTEGSWIRGLDLRNDGQKFALTGVLAPDGRLSGNLLVDQLQIAGVMGVFAPTSRPIEGLITVDLNASGTLSQPGIDGNVVASGLTQGEYDLGELTADIATQGAVIGAAARWQHERETVLAAEGRWDAARPDALDIRLRTEALDLVRIQPLSNQILASAGALDLDLQVGGNLERPEMYGTMELRDGELQLAAIGERFTNIQSRLEFQGTRLNIKRLELQSRTGPARINGEIVTRDLQLASVDISLRSDRFTAISTSALQAIITSSIDVGGSSTDLALTGEVLVNRGRFRYEGLPSGGPATVEPWELTVEGVFGPGPPRENEGDERQKPGRRPPLLPFLRADLLIDMPRNIWVQGPGTAIEASGRLKVDKDLNRPFIVAGDIRTVRGFATLLGRRFNVERGEIIFTGTPEIDPVLNVVALHRVSTYDVFVEVTGISSEPEIAFRSVPELSESDVISLLIFGRTGDKLTSSEQGSLTGALAGGVASSLLERTIGKPFGVDSVNVDLSDPNAATFGVGRYLTNDVFLSYDHTFRDPKKGNAGGSTVGIEYSVSPRFRIRATGSDFGETAVDFLWGFDY